MNLRDVLRGLLPKDGATVVYECRHCGRTLSPRAEECPRCESSGVARYRIPQ